MTGGQHSLDCSGSAKAGFCVRAAYLSALPQLQAREEVVFSEEFQRTPSLHMNPLTLPKAPRSGGDKAQAPCMSSLSSTVTARPWSPNPKPGASCLVTGRAGTAWLCGLE